MEFFATDRLKIHDTAGMMQRERDSGRAHTHAKVVHHSSQRLTLDPKKLKRPISSCAIDRELDPSLPRLPPLSGTYGYADLANYRPHPEDVTGRLVPSPEAASVLDDIRLLEATLCEEAEIHQLPPLPICDRYRFRIRSHTSPTRESNELDDRRILDEQIATPVLKTAAQSPLANNNQQEKHPERVAVSTLRDGDFIDSLPIDLRASVAAMRSGLKCLNPIERADFLNRCDWRTRKLIHYICPDPVATW